MKINGLAVSKPAHKVLVIPMNGTNFVLKARYVDNFDDFDIICPPVVPPEVLEASGKRYRDFKDASYLSRLNEQNARRCDWLYLQSLSATEGLEWDNVAADDPETWHNWRTDLLNAGMPATYVQRIITLVEAANGLDLELLDQATQSFLAGTLEGQSN